MGQPSVECVEEKLATPEPFREWLESKPYGVIVGFACDGSLCPIHQFIEESCELSDSELGFVVSESAVGGVTGGRYRYTPNPPWVRWFVSRIDSLARRKFPLFPFYSNAVDSTEALAVLVNSIP